MSGYGASAVGKVKIPYYVVPKGKRCGYWRPTKRMQSLGFSDVRCGPDGPAAWAIANVWNERWQAVRRGTAAPPSTADHLSREQAEAARSYPRGSIGEGWQRYISTDEWAAKPLSTRTKVWWPAWYRIRDVWGDVDPNVITFELMSDWRAGLEKRHGRGVAHKTLKIWRALWPILRSLKIAHCPDPSGGIRNRAPRPRHQVWSEGEATRLVKTAWRLGYRGAACIIAVVWDTLFSPVDARTLRARHLATVDGRLVFDRAEDGRTKTGRAALGTLSRRTDRLVRAHLQTLGTEMLPDAFLFRNRSGRPYREDTLADDFAAIRAAAFPGDARQLRDMRRAGTVEIVAGQPVAGSMSAKLANSIERSNTLHKTYAPIDISAVEAADEARQRGRRRMRAGGTNRVEKLQLQQIVATPAAAPTRKDR